MTINGLLKRLKGADSFSGCSARRTPLAQRVRRHRSAGLSAVRNRPATTLAHHAEGQSAAEQEEQIRPSRNLANILNILNLVSTGTPGVSNDGTRLAEITPHEC